MYSTGGTYFRCNSTIPGGGCLDDRGFNITDVEANMYFIDSTLSGSGYKTSANQVIDNQNGIDIQYKLNQQAYLGGVVDPVPAQASEYKVSDDFTWFKPTMGSTGRVMILDGTTGNLGLGTDISTNPTDKLTVLGDIRVGTSGSNGCLKDNSGGTITGTCSSDERLKTDIVPVSGILDKLTNINLVSYQWNDVAQAKGFKENVPQLGFLAQNVLANIPDLVTTDSDGYYQVDYAKIPWYTLEALKELNAKVTGLQSQVSGGGSVAGQVGNIDNLTVGSSSHRSGITLYDQTTGAPYCLSIDNGETRTVQGQCVSTDESTGTTTSSSDPTTSGTDTSSDPTTTAPSTNGDTGGGTTTSSGDVSGTVGTSTTGTAGDSSTPSTDTGNTVTGGDTGSSGTDGSTTGSSSTDTTASDSNPGGGN
jgi:hypothetical protein